MYERSQHNSASKTLGRSLHTGLLASVLLLLLVTGQHAAVWGPSVGTSLTAWLLLAAAAALATMQRVHAATDTAAVSARPQAQFAITIKEPTNWPAGYKPLLEIVPPVAV